MLRRAAPALVGLLIPFLFYRFRKPSWKTADAAVAAAE